MELTLGALLREAVTQLQAGACETPGLDARLLIEVALGLDATTLYAAPETPVDAEAASRVRALLARRLAGEPLGRIRGRREFWSLDFLLGPETLEPRPDSETLVEAALALWRGRAPPARLLDLGTGSGCLLLALLREWPGSFGIGVDYAFAAAAVARRNAVRLGMGARASFIVGDWAQALSGPFDLIVSNPPYIETAALARLPAAVKCYDPPRALDGGESGLAAYRALVPQASASLAAGGWLVLEIGATQAEAVGAILAASGFAAIGVRADLGGRPRAVSAQKPA